MREEHIFALTQALELYDVYQAKVIACDRQIEAILKRLKTSAPPPANKLCAVRQRGRQPNAPAFDARGALREPWRGPHTNSRSGALPRAKLVGERGTNLAARPSAKHFTSWLGLAPTTRSPGKVLSSKTRRTSTGPRPCCTGRDRGANRHSIGGILPAVVGARGKGEGHHRYRAQDRGVILQYSATRHVLRRPRRGVLRRSLPPARSWQPSTACEITGVRSDPGASGRCPGGCFLGSSRSL